MKRPPREIQPGHHAVLEVALSRPTRLADDLRVVAPFAFQVTEALPGHLAIAW